MRSRGPMITLLAGLALAGVLVTLSMNATNTPPDLASGAANAPASPGADNADVAPEADPSESAEAVPSESAEAVEEGAEAGEGDEAAPAEQANNKKTTWAGDVSDGKSTIAIVRQGDEAIAYVCDGDKIEAWLHGDAADGKLKLATLDKSPIEAELTGTFGNGRAKGTITVEGKELGTFNAKTVQKPSGLFRATADVRGARLEGGWIVLPDGTQVGLANFAGSPVAVPPLNLADLTTTVFGAKITAKPVAPGGAG